MDCQQIYQTNMSKNCNFSGNVQSAMMTTTQKNSGIRHYYVFPTEHRA
jgi:hypothetical protein